MSELLHCPAPDVEWLDNVLMRVEVGSTAHGTGLEGHEDYDEMGIYAPTWQQWIGLPIKHNSDETIVYRPGRGSQEASQPGDYDLVLHTARKFCSLSAAGNPSMLVALFGPVRYMHPCGLGQELLSLRPAFWSQQAKAKFLGYMTSQRERMQGTRGAAGRLRRNPGTEGDVDWKYAMHMLRLGMQGIEYMTWGSIQLPMSDYARRYLLDVRQGHVPLSEVIEVGIELETRLQSIETDAPDQPNWDAINNWLQKVYEFSRDG